VIKKLNRPTRFRLKYFTATWLLLLVLLTGQPVSADAAFIQSKNFTVNNGGSVSATFNSSATADNLLVAICASQDNTTLTVPSGFSTAINQNSASRPSQAIAYKVAAGGESTITCTSSSSSSKLGIHIYEYSGLATSNLLNSTGSSNGSGASVSSGNVTTTNDEVLLVAGMVSNHGSASFGGTWSNSFTMRENFSTSGGNPASRSSFGGADRSVTSTGTYSTTVSTGESATWRGQIAAFKVAPPPLLSVDIVDSGGSPVASPSVGLSSVDTDFECQTSTGILGTSSQKIRVTNTTANGNWTLSIAATDGPTALWSNGSNTYDFNNPSGAPAGCTGGQLTVDTIDNGSITPEGSCSSSGISKDLSAFSQGVTNNVTLLSASGSQTGCYFDLEGIELFQKIPSEVPSSITPYTINMTLTVTAN
jgi:hypothetical protein